MITLIELLQIILQIIDSLYRNNEREPIWKIWYYMKKGEPSEK